jgi:hypothetical protein
MEWIVVVVLALILLATIFVVRRSGSPLRLGLTRPQQRDLTMQTRLAEDDARDAINERERDIAP